MVSIFNEVFLICFIVAVHPRRMAPKGGARQAALAAAGLDTTQARSQQRSRSPRAKGGAKQLARSQQPSASSTAPALAQPPATGEPTFRNLVNKLFMENRCFRSDGAADLPICCWRWRYSSGRSGQSRSQWEALWQLSERFDAGFT